MKSFDKQALKKNMDLAVIQPRENLTIKGDSLFLTRIFENLISNALKFSEQGKRVEVQVLDDNGKALIRIEDSGPGLTPEDMQMIFTKFQRLSAKANRWRKFHRLGAIHC